jgi:predicted nucleotidyltransferase
MANSSKPVFEAILRPGTQVVTLVEVRGAAGSIAQPLGAVGVVVQAPTDHQHAYRIRFPDGFEAPLSRDRLVTLGHYHQDALRGGHALLADHNLFGRVIYCVIVGSRAYGLDDPASDVDRRGVYLPPAELHWSLYGVPEQLENEARQEAYWELQKFVTLALKANPNVLECLYSPLVETATPLAQELIALRERFLSRLVYQTYNGYVMSQFRKLSADLRQHGAVKWKHVMHLVRLLLAGITVLHDGYVPVRVDEHRAELLAIKRGEIPWETVNRRRVELHARFDEALAQTRLPERPDYAAANALLVRARRAALAEELP